MRRGAREPKLVLVEEIGKDGCDEMSSATLPGADRLSPPIDGMPMRQERMRRGASPRVLAPGAGLI